jgi:hypothetical protein
MNAGQRFGNGKNSKLKRLIYFRAVRARHRKSPMVASQLGSKSPLSLRGRAAVGGRLGRNGKAVFFVCFTAGASWRIEMCFF